VAKGLPATGMFVAASNTDESSLAALMT